MNNDRRKKIKNEISQLEAAKEAIETVEIGELGSYLENVRTNISVICDDEQDAFDNMPEGLQCSMRGEIAEECIDLMTDAINLFDDIVEVDEVNREDFNDILDEIIDLLNEVIDL